MSPLEFCVSREAAQAFIPAPFMQTLNSPTLDGNLHISSPSLFLLVSAHSFLCQHCSWVDINNFPPCRFPQVFIGFSPAPLSSGSPKSQTLSFPQTEKREHCCVSPHGSGTPKKPREQVKPFPSSTDLFCWRETCPGWGMRCPHPHRALGGSSQGWQGKSWQHQRL